MPTKRLSMKKIREILRLKLTVGLTHRATAQSLGVSSGKVSEVASRASRLALDWKTIEGLSDEELEVRLLGPKLSSRTNRARPDCAWIHRELRRTGVTLQLLHIEYLAEHESGLRYSAFCDAYKRWLAKKPVVMRQIHRAGDKTFLDYSGKKPKIVDAQTGEVREVELFVATLGASSYTYATATLTQQLPDWISANEKAFRFFGGVTQLQVPDQLRSAVKDPCRYEPGINRTYLELAKHYGKDRKHVFRWLSRHDLVAADYQQ